MTLLRQLRGPALLVVAVLSAALLAGCFGGSGKTKAGVGASRSLTLKMPSPDSDDPDAAYFADQVKARTHGRIGIVIDGDAYNSSDPDNELRLVRDLRRGKVAIAYLPSRAWDRDGITSFQALEAPFLVTEYELLRRITTGPIGQRMLHGLDRAGLIGLGLVPKELRRPLGRQPLTSPRAFKGARIRVVTSPTSVLDLRALDAVPLTHFDARQALLALSAHRLDGVESEAHAILSNGYTYVAPYLPGNLALFAKAQTIVISRDAFDRLDSAEQAALRAAARATVAHADPEAQERSEVAALCSQGLRIVQASAGDIAALRRAAAPAYAALERDAATKRAISAIEQLERSVPASASSLRACPRSRQAVATRAGAFPQGVFESRVTPADFRREHARVDPTFPLPWRISIHAGRWKTNEHPPFSGRYVVSGDEITFVIQEPPENRGTRETVKWTYYRGELTLRIVSVADSGSRAIYRSHPWRRIGR
jgi:TRAP-type transport system periplasmic protein